MQYRAQNTISDGWENWQKKINAGFLVTKSPPQPNDENHKENIEKSKILVF